MKRTKPDLATSTYADLQNALKDWVMGKSYREMSPNLHKIANNVDKLAAELEENATKAAGMGGCCE